MKSIAITAAELIDSHLDYKNLKSNHNTEEALIRAYKIAAQDLMAYIGKQIKYVTTIPELVDCFYYSCYGFGALGQRADLLEEKLIGPQKTPASALDRAVDKDIDRYDNGWIGFDPYHFLRLEMVYYMTGIILTRRIGEHWHLCLY